MDKKEIFVDYRGGKMKCHVKDVFGSKQTGVKTEPQMMVCERLGVEAKIKLPTVVVGIDDMEDGTVTICEHGEPHDKCKDYNIIGNKISGIYYRDKSGVDVKIMNKKYQDNGWI